MGFVAYYNSLIVGFVFIVSIIIEMIVLPRVIFITKKKRLFDLPDKRKKHREPIPRLGGLTFTPIILLVTLFSLFVRFKLRLWTEDLFFYSLPELLLFICGLIMIYLVGVKDDLVGVNYQKKFIIQFLSSLCIVGSGLYINNLYGLFGFYEIPHWVGIMITLGLIVFTTNAVNLIDGADGLASGLASVGLISYAIFFLMNGMWLHASMAIASLGVLIPFFYYNFFHKSRKIFMGDTGSLTLGFILIFFFLKVINYPTAVVDFPNGLILLAIAPIFIPLFDACKVMVVRIAMGKTPFHPDRNHIHHKLLDLGFTKKKMVYTLILSAILFVVINYFILKMWNVNLVFFIDILIATSVNVLIYRKMRKGLPSATKS